MEEYTHWFQLMHHKNNGNTIIFFKYTYNNTIKKLKYTNINLSRTSCNNLSRSSRCTFSRSIRVRFSNAFWFHFSHSCKGHFFLLVFDEPDTEQPFTEPILTPPLKTYLISNNSDHLDGQINFHALSGFSSINTMHIIDKITKPSTIVLIDGGSTHNFIQSCMTKFFNLPYLLVNTFKVMVGKDNLLEYQSICNEVELTLK